MKSENVSKYEFENELSAGFELKDHQINMRKNLFLIFAQDTKKTVSMLVNNQRILKKNSVLKKLPKRLFLRLQIILTT